ncbi:hypothetical protein [Azospirillum cavernae]|uniref:hypothetical protein n=1 Tax=Azospirillum cavernae TaxID=2320860 RepID=UPI0018F77D8E|nr:hypothetical protein [Azospirillum cavernae]
MVAYSFKKRFAPPILLGLKPGPLLPGAKRQTIRANRKRHARPTEELQLYTGMRTSSCQLLGKPTCTAVRPVRLMLGQAELVEIKGEPNITDAKGLDLFARFDGFQDWADLRDFWAETHEAVLDFSGVLIRWEPKCDGLVQPLEECGTQEEGEGEGNG